MTCSVVFSRIAILPCSTPAETTTSPVSSSTATRIGLAAADITTGEFIATEIAGETLAESAPDCGAGTVATAAGGDGAARPDRVAIISGAGGGVAA